MKTPYNVTFTFVDLYHLIFLSIAKVITGMGDTAQFTQRSTSSLPTLRMSPLISK